MLTINHATLATKLNTINGATLVSFKSETAQSSLNKGRGANAMVESIGINPDNIVKHTALVGLVGKGVTYEKMVEHRLVKEGTPKDEAVFEAGSLPWGEWVKGSEKLLITHKGGLYLRVYCVSANVPKVEHFLEGASIDLKDDKFNPWRKAEKSEGENQGLEKPIVVRTYGFGSIKEITLDGETFQVVQD